MGLTLLGEIDLPEGILVLLDPGLARFWRHDGEPTSPRKSDPPQRDLVLVGPDAERAGRAYDREFDPFHLFDIADVPEAIARFAEFAAKGKLDARAEELPERITHVARAERALAVGKGLDVAKYNGLWAVVVGDLPKNKGLRVIGMPMPPGDHERRWKSIDVVIDESATIARSDEVSGIMVDHGQILFAGLGPLGHFKMWESIDGLGDFVFRGRDAKALAARVDASSLDEDEYGWRDVVLGMLGEKADRVQGIIKAEKLAVGVDYRPHCNLERLNAQVRKGGDRAGRLALGGARVVGCDNRWGDGIFEVSRHFDAAGNVVRVRVELGTPKRQAMMERLMISSLAAIVSRAILDKGEPVRFAERTIPNNPRDSGWLFSAGTESQAYIDDARNLAIVQIDTLLERFPELGPILTAPVGALFRRKGKVMVPDDE